MTAFGNILDRVASDPAFAASIGRALFVAAERVSVESKISLTTGAVSGKNHVPSRPGEPPNNDSGTLAASHEVELIAWNRARVSVNAPYAVPLEFGTSRMAARPYLGPAARKVRPTMNALVKKAYKAAIVRAAAGDK